MRTNTAQKFTYVACIEIVVMSCVKFKKLTFFGSLSSNQNESFFKRCKIKICLNIVFEKILKNQKLKSYSNF